MNRKARRRVESVYADLVTRTPGTRPELNKACASCVGAWAREIRVGRYRLGWLISPRWPGFNFFPVCAAVFVFMGGSAAAISPASRSSLARPSRPNGTLDTTKAQPVKTAPQCWRGDYVRLRAMIAAAAPDRQAQA